MNRRISLKEEGNIDLGLIHCEKQNLKDNLGKLSQKLDSLLRIMSERRNKIVGEEDC